MRRSRNGCATCRRRKKKCDETQPVCNACQAKGLPCGGYAVSLRWGNTVASRGRLAGQTIPILPPDGQGHSPGRSADTSPESLTSVHHPETPPNPVPSGPSDISNIPTSISDSTQNHLLFDKFRDYGFRFLYSTKSGVWLETLLDDLAREDSALFYVAVAIQVYLDEGVSVRALEHMEHALRAYRHELAVRSDRIVATTMCSGLMLGTLHRLQGRPWTQHIQLMAELYGLTGDLTKVQFDPEHDLAVRYLMEVLAVKDLPHFVIGRVTSSFHLWKRFREMQQTWVDGLPTGIEVFSGLPRSLLDIFAAIPDGEEEMEMRLWQWPGEIAGFLHCHLWECWRLAGILNIRRRRGTKLCLSPGKAQTDGVEQPIIPDNTLLLFRLLVSIDALLEGMQRPENNHLLVYHGALYPLVEASLQVSILQSHPDWMESLRKFRVTLLRPYAEPVVHFAHMLFEILDEAWEAGDDSFDVDEAAKKRNVELVVF